MGHESMHEQHDPTAVTPQPVSPARPTAKAVAITLRTQRFRNAVVEAISVLFGVLAAFAINAWWENSRDRRVAETNLVAFWAEVEHVRDAISTHRESIADARASDLSFLRDVVMQPIGSASREDVDSMIWNTGPVPKLPLPQAALDDLTSTGALLSIESGDLRRAIGTYAAVLSAYNALQDESAEHWRDGMGPYYLRHASLGDMMPASYELAGLARGTFPTDLGAFVANREFANMLMARVLWYDSMLLGTDRFLARIDSLDAALSQSEWKLGD